MKLPPTSLRVRVVIGIVLAIVLYKVITLLMPRQHAAPIVQVTEADPPATPADPMAFAAANPDRIVMYESAIVVGADDTTDVTERVTLHRETVSQRPELGRTFSTEYKDSEGHYRTVGFDVLDFSRDGKPVQWTLRKDGNVRDLSIVADAGALEPVDAVYTLHFRTNRSIGFDPDRDNLSWRPIDTETWHYAIAAARVDVTMPAPVPAADLKIDGVTRQAFNEDGHDLTATVEAPGHARWTLTRPLGPDGGSLAISLDFPKGIVTPPSRATWWRWFYADHDATLIVGAGVLLAWLYCLAVRLRIRKPRAETTIVRYEPPAGFSPGSLAHMDSMVYDESVFWPDVLDLAVAGRIRIEIVPGVRSGDDSTWHLFRNDPEHVSPLAPPVQSTAPPEEEALFQAFFPPGIQRRNITDREYLNGMWNKPHRAALNRRFYGTLLVNRHRNLLIPFVISLCALAAPAVLGVDYAGHGFAITLLYIVLWCTFMIFANAIAVPTTAGQRLREGIAGFDRYLKVVITDDLSQLPDTGHVPEAAVPDKAGKALRYLPYAVALGRASLHEAGAQLERAGKAATAVPPNADRASFGARTTSTP